MTTQIRKYNKPKPGTTQVSATSQQVSSAVADMSGYLRREEFERYFELVNVGSEESPVTAIHALYAGLYSDGFLSGFGSGSEAAGGGGGGLDEETLAAYLTDHAYATQDWVLAQKYLKAADLTKYVTLDTEQTITGQKTFKAYIRLENPLMFKNAAREDGIYFAFRDDSDVLQFSHHKNYVWWKNIGTLSIDGRLTMNSFVKAGGTASQVLMADGSVQTHWKAADVTTATSDTGMITPLAMRNWTASQYQPKGNYVTLDTDQIISGAKTFSALLTLNNGCKVGQALITYDATIGAVKIDGNVYATGFMSGFGPGSGSEESGGGVSALSLLTDVALSNPVSGQALVYNGSKWVNQAVSAQAGVTELGVSGDYLTWTKDATVHQLTVPYATNADKLDGFHVSSLQRRLYTYYNNFTAIDDKTDANMMTYVQNVFAYVDTKYYQSETLTSNRCQVAYGYNYDFIKFRRYYNNEWSDWQTILTSANFATALDSAYVKKSGDTMTGNLTMSGTNTALVINNGVRLIYANNLGYLQLGDSTNKAGVIATMNGTTLASLNILCANNALTTNGNVLWHAGNDGSGSGLDADLLDGCHEAAFFRTNRATIPIGYVKLEESKAGLADYANYPSGTYIVSREGYSDMLVNLAVNYGSTSALQFLTSYSDIAGLRFRKTIDTNRVSGPWRTILTELNIGSYNAGSATKLADNTAFKAWGQIFFENGKPKNATGVFETLADVRIGSSAAYFQASNGVWNLALGISSSGNSGLLQRTRDNWILGYNDSSLNTWLGILGNVGIGTSSPAYKLDVNGSAQIIGALNIVTGADTKLIFNNTDGELYTRISFREAGTEYASITARSADVAVTGKALRADLGVKIGSATLSYDSATGMLKCDKGFYSMGTVAGFGTGSSTAAGSLQYFTEQTFYESTLGIGTLNSLVPTTLLGCIGTEARPLRMLYTKEIMGLSDITSATYWPKVPGTSAIGGSGDRFGVGYINDLYINRLFVNGTQITSFGGGTAGGTKLSISGSTLSLKNASDTVLSSVTLPTAGGALPLAGGTMTGKITLMTGTESLGNAYLNLNTSATNANLRLHLGADKYCVQVYNHSTRGSGLYVGIDSSTNAIKIDQSGNIFLPANGNIYLSAGKHIYRDGVQIL